MKAYGRNVCIFLYKYTICYNSTSLFHCFTWCVRKWSILLLQLSLPSPLKPCVKSRMKMYLGQRRQAMRQLHLSNQQFNCILRCDISGLTTTNHKHFLGHIWQNRNQLMKNSFEYPHMGIWTYLCNQECACLNNNATLPFIMIVLRYKSGYIHCCTWNKKSL